MSKDCTGRTCTCGIGPWSERGVCENCGGTDLGLPFLPLLSFQPSLTEERIAMLEARLAQAEARLARLEARRLPLPPVRPANPPLGAGNVSGYSCASCGTWVPYGSVHTCRGLSHWRPCR